MNTETRSPALSWWNDLGRNRQIGFAIGLLLLIAAVAAFAWFSLRSDFVPLTGSLTKEDTAAVVAQLEDIHARYQVENSTGALLVPAAEADSIRAQLAQKGWPLKTSAGFELFDNGDFGMTEFTERINYQRALEGELARTIMALDYVRYARVHLVLPQSSLFKRAAEAPKASVLLIGHHGESLSEPQIAGIQRMVASAVPDLKPDGVSVHDHKGIELTTTGGSAVSPSAVDAEIHAQSDVEDYLSAKAEEVLGRIFPPGAATVSINVKLMRNHVSSSRDEVLPSGQGSGAVSRIRSDTPPEGTGLPHGGLREPSPSDKAEAVASPQFDVEYRIGHVVEQTESAPGGIERLSVGVVIPDPGPQGLTIDAVKDLVATGIGLDLQRGDRIAVYSVTSSAKATAPGATAAYSENGHPTAERPKPFWALLLGVALLLGAIAVWLGRPRQGRQMSASERQDLLNQVKVWLQQ